MFEDHVVQIGQSSLAEFSQAHSGSRQQQSKTTAHCGDWPIVQYRTLHEKMAPCSRLLTLRGTKNKDLALSIINMESLKYRFS